MNLKELYQEIILDHGKNPRNLRKTENFNKDAKGHNPLCGDQLDVFINVEDNIISDLSFIGFSGLVGRSDLSPGMFLLGRPFSKMSEHSGQHHAASLWGFA